MNFLNHVLKYSLLSITSLFLPMNVFSQIGISTESPKVTLDIEGRKTDASVADGLLIPRLTLGELVSKDNEYTPALAGTMVYITDVSATQSAKTSNVKRLGFYTFNGSVWLGMQPNSGLKFMYMPPVLLPLDNQDPSYNAVTGTFSVDLYQLYADQFSLSHSVSSAKNPSGSRLGVIDKSALDYFVTYYDPTIFTNLSIDNNGILTYKLPAIVSLTNNAFVNVVFQIKK